MFLCYVLICSFLLLQAHGMEAFAVVPLNWCPHLETVVEVPPEGLSVETPCAECDQVGENWVCLICYQVHSNLIFPHAHNSTVIAHFALQVMCSRYVAGHMVIHGQTSGHNLVLSFSDLSVWCYACDAYIHNEVSVSTLLFL